MGTWPGNPPSVVPDFANVKPGDFDPEPNWRSMYEEMKQLRDAVVVHRDQLLRLIDELEDEIECLVKETNENCPL